MFAILALVFVWSFAQEVIEHPVAKTILPLAQHNDINSSTTSKVCNRNFFGLGKKLITKIGYLNVICMVLYWNSVFILYSMYLYIGLSFLVLQKLQLSTPPVDEYSTKILIAPRIETPESGPTE